MQIVESGSRDQTASLNNLWFNLDDITFTSYAELTIQDFSSYLQIAVLMRWRSYPKINTNHNLMLRKRFSSRESSFLSNSAIHAANLNFLNTFGPQIRS